MENQKECWQRILKSEESLAAEKFSSFIEIVEFETQAKKRRSCRKNDNGIVIDKKYRFRCKICNAISSDTVGDASNIKKHLKVKEGYLLMHFANFFYLLDPRHSS